MINGHYSEPPAGPRNFSTITYEATGPQSGHIDRDGKRVDYFGFEPITDNSDAANRIIRTSTDSDQIRLTSANAAGQMTVESENLTFESVTFNIPSTSLTIEGDEGNDTFLIDTFDPAFTPGVGLTMTVDLGGGSDTIQIRGLPWSRGSP